MVDPVEIKLDEIEDHVLKTQADVDRLMRDFSKPEKGRELMAQLPGGGNSGVGGGGFIDQVLKAVGGGGATGAAMTGGISGGMAAAGILKLAEVIAELLGYSKIALTVIGTVGKALGLLLDVVLLPFLPILTMGIIWLYQGVMLFYKLWNGIWSSKVIQGLGKVLGDMFAILSKGLSALYSIEFGFLGAGAETVWNVLKWLWQISDTGGVLTMGLEFILGTIETLLNWLHDLATGKDVFTPVINFVLGTFGDLLNWLYNAVTTGIKLSLDFTSNLKEVPGLGDIITSAENAGSDLADLFGLGGTKSAATSDQGLLAGAMAGGSSGSSTSINIYGYTDQKLQGVIENVLRRQNNRFNA